MRRQKFPAQGSIEIHEDNEVGWVSEGVWVHLSGQDFSKSPRLVDSCLVFTWLFV